MIENIDTGSKDQNKNFPFINSDFSLKKSKNREKVLKKAIEILTSEESIEVIQQDIVNLIGKAFRCDRCFVRIFDSNLDNFKNIETEYRSDEHVKSFIGYNFPETFSKMVNSSYKNSKCFYLPDIETFSKNLLPEQSILLEVLNAFEVKSNYCCPISQGNYLAGAFIVHFTKNKTILTKEELEIIQLTAKQLLTLLNKEAVSRKQAEYYEKSKKQAERERLQKEIITTIRQNLDLNLIKNTFVTELGKALHADRTVFVEYDDKAGRFLPIEEFSEYRHSEDILSVKDCNIEEYPYFNSAFKDGMEVLVQDSNEFISVNKLHNTYNEEYIKKYSIKSGVGMPIVYGNQVLGRLMLHYTRKTVLISQEDINFIRDLANQAGIALFQSKLYTTTKKQAAIEKLLRQLTEKIRCSVDINDTLTFICDEVTKVFNVQRTSITQVYPPYSKGNFLPIREYKARKELKGLKDFKYPNRTAAYIAETSLDKGINLVINNIEKSDTPDYFKKIYELMGVKSILCVPIKKEEDKFGTIVISEYDYHRRWTYEEISLLETIADQIYIAITQEKLYLTTKEQAEREILLRKIIETIRNSLDINEIKLNIVTEVGKAFNADRCFIRIFDNDKDNYIHIDDYSEYLSSSKLKRIVEFQIPPEINQIIKIFHKKHSSIIIPDCKTIDIVQNIDLNNLKEHFEFFEVKSNYGFPILYGGELLGTFVIHYTKSQINLSAKDIELLKTIANQAGVALKQAELFNTTKKQVQKENLLRSITQIIMSSLDEDKIKSSIINEIGKAINADRCIVIEADKKNVLLPIKYEYLSSKKVRSYRGLSVEEYAKDLSDRIKSGQIIIMKDFSKYIKNLDVKPIWKNLGLKSGFIVPITYYDKIIGCLVINYVDVNKTFSYDDIELVKDLSNQIGIALTHAQLYGIEKKRAKIHNAEVKIISAIKSSMNIKECLYLICSEIAALLDIKQVIIDNYNEKAKIIKTIRAYAPVNKSSTKLSEDLKESLFDKIIRQGENIIVNNIQISNDLLKEIYDDNYSALLLVPIKSGSEKFGAVTVLDNKPRNWSEEEISLLEKLSDYISIAIKNANLYTQAQFISNVSHELKTPIAAINGYAEAIMYNDPDKSEITTNFINIIQKNAERLNNILDSLLHISTIQKNTQSEKQVFNNYSLTELIYEAISQCCGRMASKGIQVHFESKQDITLKVNSQLIEQALINLIINAINYSGNNTHILVELIQEPDEVKIQVTDEGIGIKERDLTNIFEPFYRADKSRNRETGGTGLGLSIVKSIMDAHNGKVTVKSKYGEGSTFTLHLPYCK